MNQHIAKLTVMAIALAASGGVSAEAKPKPEPVKFEVVLPDEAFRAAKAPKGGKSDPPTAKPKRVVGFKLSHPNRDDKKFVRATTTAGYIIERGTNAWFETSKDGRKLYLVVPDRDATSTIGIDTAIAVRFNDQEPYSKDLTAAGTARKLNHYEVKVADLAVEARPNPGELQFGLMPRAKKKD